MFFLPSEKNMRDVNFWARELGLLPVPLLDNEQRGGFVLLNGSRGNFYLNTTGEGIENCDKAWSSDVGHVVNLQKDHVELQRWDRPSIFEKYTYKSISEKLAKFHSYLEANEPPRKYSIVGHVAGIFDNLRRLMGEKHNGGQALKAFLVLLACSEVDKNIEDLQCDKWGIDPSALGIASSISDSDWNALLDQIKHKHYFIKLTPYINLVLRHASGLLFQEAHYRALMSNQMLLPGFMSSEKMRKIDIGNNVGIYFTPPAIARTLVEECIVAFGELPPALTIFDPSCGSGEFLREALRILNLRGYNGKVKLIGWDTSAIAVDMAKFVISREIAYWPKDRVECEIVQNDSVIEKWPTNIEMIIMNPPFNSWQQMSEAERERMLDILKDIGEKKPNLASVFAYKAADSVKTNGVLGAVLPQSFALADSARNIRQYIADRFCPKLIAKLGNQAIFQNAIVDTSLYVGKKEKLKEEPAKLVWVDFRPESLCSSMRALRNLRTIPADYGGTIIANDNYSIYYDGELGKNAESWTPKPYRAWETFKQLANFTKVREIFNIHQGVRMGHDIFLLSVSEYNSLAQKEQRFFRPAVVNDSINSGRLESKTYVWYPNSKGLPDIHSEQDLKKYVPTYYKDYLRPRKETLLKRARIKEANWWKLSEHRAWLVESSPKIVSTYFGDVGSFAWDTKGDHVVVVGNGWIPKGNNLKLMSNKIGLAYVALLSSSILSTLLAAVSVHVGGGQWDLSAKYIKEMPLPDLFSRTFPYELFMELEKFGEDISKGKSVDQEGLNNLCSIIYTTKTE